MANKKILKSQFSGKKWNDYRVISLPIKDLWASVPKAETHKGKPFYSRLAEDIAQNGLHYPLLVVHATRRELMERMKACEDTFCELPFDESKGNLNVRLYVIWGGSNRVRVAEELGFTHVDCVVVESFNRAVELQRTHRKPYTEKYYIPPRPASFQVSPSELTLENSPPSESRDALWKNALPKLLEALNQPDAGVNDWINFGICKEALGDHLQAARAFIKAHELDPDKFSTFAYILRNLYLARDFNLLVDYLTYCKHFSPKFTAAFSKEPYFAELFAHEPFKTLADPKQTLPPAETDDSVDEPAAEVKEGNSGVMDEAALSVLEEAVKNDPENEHALFNYGLGLKAMDRYAEAAETFLKVQGINPRNEAVYSMVFLCLFRAENRDMLLNFANYCVGVSSELIINFSEDPIYSELFQQSEFKELLEFCKQYRKAELGQQKISSDELSGSAAGSRDLMQQYEDLLRDEALLGVLSNAVEQNPEDVISWLNYGVSLQAFKRYDEAATALFKAQELDPQNEAIYPAIFRCLYAAEDYDQLLIFTAYCAELCPKIVEKIAVDDFYAEIFSRPEFKRLVASEESEEIQGGAADARNDRSDDQEAVNESLMGQFEALLKDQTMLPVLKKAIQMDPSNKAVWLNYGNCLKAQNNFEDAVDAFLRAQKLDPDDHEIYALVFQCMYKIGYPELASYAELCLREAPEIMEVIVQNPLYNELFMQPDFLKLLSKKGTVDRLNYQDDAAIPGGDDLMQEYETLLQNESSLIGNCL